MDHKAIERWLWEDRDFPELLASVDAAFLGHRLEVETGNPVFRFRVGSNEIQQGVTLTDDGRIEIRITCSASEPLRFKVASEGLSDPAVEGGVLKDGVWTLKPACQCPVRLCSARIERRPV